MNTFLNIKELKGYGFKYLGKNVKISRNAVIYSPELVEIGDNVRIDDFTTISGKVKICNHVHIAQGCGLYGGDEGIVMEDYSGLSARVLIYATSNDYSGELMTNPTLPDQFVGDISKEVVLEKHAVIGCGSIILPGVVIGRGAAVGAMTLCNKSLEPWGIYGGSPARRLKDRKKDILEKEREFVAYRRKKSDFIVGDSATVTRVVTEEIINLFAQISGDENPIHMDNELATSVGFSGRIAHGIFSESMISMVIGTKLPGEGTIYLEQDTKYRSPLYVGDVCTAKVEVSDILDPIKGIYKLNTCVSKKDGSTVCEGYAIVKYI